MNPQSIIANAYKFERIHSENGGMGVILLVSHLQNPTIFLALKYCRDDNPEVIQRFRREARLMKDFEGNGKVVQLIDVNLEHEPPYIVMPFYEDGDLLSLSSVIKDNLELQEKIFLQMAECVHELHRKNTYHRDIKPQNFLRLGTNLVISDFGLSMELDSSTQNTRSSQYWGTPGYIPPEFYKPGGFKNARPESDIFMLGKSYYSLLTGDNPTYMDPALLPRPIAAVIERCVDMNPARRFQSIPQLCQSLASAYDALLGRSDPVGSAGFLLDEIQQQLKSSGRYDSVRVTKFLESFLALERDQAWLVALKLEDAEFGILSTVEFEGILMRFLELYEDIVLNEPKDFAYAETVAHAMNIVFRSCGNLNHRSKAFEISVRMSIRMHRFAAMETCIEMVTSVATHDAVGSHLATVIARYPEDFLKNIEVVNVKHPQIRSAILNCRRGEELS